MGQMSLIFDYEHHITLNEKQRHDVHKTTVSRAEISRGFAQCKDIPRLGNSIYIKRTTA